MTGRREYGRAGEQADRWKTGKSFPWLGIGETDWCRQTQVNGYPGKPIFRLGSKQTTRKEINTRYHRIKAKNSSRLKGRPDYHGNKTRTGTAQQRQLHRPAFKYQEPGAHAQASTAEPAQYFHLKLESKGGEKEKGKKTQTLCCWVHNSIRIYLLDFPLI